MESKPSEAQQPSSPVGADAPTVMARAADGLRAGAAADQPIEPGAAMVEPTVVSASEPADALGPGGTVISSLGAVVTAGGTAIARRPANTHLPKTVGRFRIDGLLGRGGMGVVYRAFDPMMQRAVALKLLSVVDRGDQEKIERFLREAQMAGSLRHPYIVNIYEIGQHEDAPWVAMELFEGRPLNEAISGAGVSDLKTRLTVFRDVTRAVAHAHAHGVVHRDLKPTNILVDERLRPCVLDFGLARRLDTARALTADGQLMGTPGYMPPEQIVGDVRRIGPHTDVFALGVLLYDLLTGCPPFNGKTQMEVIACTLRGEFVAPRRIRADLPRDAETVCMQAMENDIARRYPNAAVLADEIDRLIAGDPVLARPMSFAECWWRRLARHRAIVGASVLVILVGGGWAAVDRLRAERGLELALLDAGRFRRQDQPAEARDFYRRALDIAPDHSAARAGLSWADAALLRMREEAAQARAEVAESRELLRKSGLVSSVLARWGRLFETVRRLEMGFYDSTLSDEGKREATATPWRKLERFMAETPADATSQSVMFALCGWARRLAGHDAEGLDWLARARELDPDLPYGAFFEAWAAFVRTLAEAPLPTVLFRGSGVEFGPAMADTDVLIQVKADLERWSVEAGRARVWGEGLAQDFRALLDGGQQLRTGDYAAAEESFTRVLGGGLQAFRNDVLLARARSRYLRKEFSAASEDYEEVLDTRPSHAETWYALAQVRAAAGVDRLASAVDAREAFQAAVVAMDQALGLRPGWGMALHARGLMQTDLARAEGARGADPRPLLHRAIADLDAAIGSNARDEVYRHNRGITRLALAEAIGARGGDADAAYRAAIQDFTDALAINSAYHASVSSRGAAWMALGNALAQVGGDCEAAYRQSVTDLEDVLRRVPDLVEAHQNLGIVQCALGNRCAGTAAGQAGALLETARRHFREAVRLAPGLVTAWNSLGIVHIDLAGLEKSAGRDPRPGMKEAVAALDEALKRAPEYVLALDARGVAWRNLAEAELALGGDPSEQLRCARQDHESALRVNPEYANAHHNLGRVLQTEVAAAVKRGEDPANRYEAAIVAYRAALSRAPTSVSSHYRLGITLRDFGQFLISQQRDARSTFRDAIVAFSDALDRDPGHVNARHGRATAHFRLAAQLEGHAGDPRAEYYAAEADFRHVLAEDPAVLGNQAYCGLAAELGALAEAARGGDGASAFARALSDYQQRITAFPRDLMAHVRRILVFRHLGRVAEARTACDAALEVAPEDETLKQWRKELESPERK